MTYKYIPVSKEETYELIRRAQAGDEEARTLLVEQNTGLVKKLALKFATAEYETDDLIQLGYIGLLKAADKFDPQYNVMFSTYAVPMIMGEIRRFFRDSGRIKASRSLKSEISALKKAQDQLEKENGSRPRISEVAEAMGISVERVNEIMEAESALSGIASLDSRPVEEEYGSRAVQGSPENDLDILMIREEIKGLGDKERQVIVLRYYRDMTQQEIARIMGISQVQVSRIEKRALAAIKKRIAE